MVKKEFILSAMIIVIIDQLTKLWVETFLPNVEGSRFWFHLVKNTGAGFGILKDYTFGLAIVSMLAVVLIFYYYKEIKVRKLDQILYGLFLGGVIGNLIDRLFRSYVIDFIDFKVWPAFNVADVAITVGAIGIVLLYWNK